MTVSRTPYAKSSDRLAAAASAVGRAFKGAKGEYAFWVGSKGSCFLTSRSVVMDFCLVSFVVTLTVGFNRLLPVG